MTSRGVIRIKQHGVVTETETRYAPANSVWLLDRDEPEPVVKKLVGDEFVSVRELWPWLFEDENVPIELLKIG
jgi:hypothetical protein